MLDVAALPDRQPDLHGRSFNLFRRIVTPELRCAVPADLVVPRFVVADGWEFVGTLDAQDASPPGFDPRVARAVTGWNGFYLFETWRR